MTKIVKREAPRLIQGVILRCIDGHWTDRDGLTPPGPLLALGTTRALQCWQDQHPVDTIIENPDESLPDVDALNEQIPMKEWEIDRHTNAPKPPWQLNYVVYLLNVDTADTYTFLNSTAGARIAVERLADKFKFMRAMRGPNVAPIVRLDSRPMKTNYGQKIRPEFTVVEWRELGAQMQEATPQLEHKTVGTPVAPVTLAEELNDEIPH
jgi:hypothetical protein